MSPNMRALADTPIETIVAARGHVAHAGVTAGLRPFWRSAVALAGILGLITVATLPGHKHVSHLGLPRAPQIKLAPSSKVHSKGTLTNVSPSSPVSLEAQSVIEGWFALPQVPRTITATSTIPSIRILRAFPSQRLAGSSQFN
jgi:hypothetical protein